MCIRDSILTDYQPAATAFEMTKNPDYYDAANIALDGLAYQVIKDSQQALMSYQNGDLDITLLNGEQVEPVSYTHLVPRVLRPCRSWKRTSRSGFWCLKKNKCILKAPGCFKRTAGGFDA